MTTDSSIVGSSAGLLADRAGRRRSCQSRRLAGYRSGRPHVYRVCMDMQRTYFRLCSSCKRELPFESTYFTCSVSTCNRRRTGLTFCSLPCFEAHVPIVRHREAWAEEQRAPTRDEWAQQQAAELAEAAVADEPARDPKRERRIVGVGTSGAQPALRDEALPRDVLIVASKLKAYIRARSGMNTSDGVMDALSDIVRELCDGAIRKAAADGRKTVLDRDF
jgi:hypothetical protein